MAIPPATGRDGRVITFYSYKGGTGRSLALANVAWVLANNGLRVLVIDWDLEAPGLNRYFAPFLIDPDLRETPGLIDMVWDFATEAMNTAPGGGDDDDDPEWFQPLADFRKYAVALRYDFPDGGVLEFVPAGRQDAGYAERVGSFAWRRFYEEMGGGVFLEAAREKAVDRYDYVLIDSRTGVSDTSGVCTIHLPDSLVICFTANNQSIRGAAGVASTVRAAWAGQPGRAGKPKRIIPLLTRVDPFEKSKLNLRRDLARAEFTGLPSEAVAPGGQGLPELPYIPFFSYEETLATFADRPGEKEAALLPALERLTGLVTDGRYTTLGKPPDETERKRILDLFEGRGATAAAVAQKTVAAERFDVFLSYHRADAAAVEDLANRLSHEGVRPWFDRWALIPGDSWDAATVEAIKSCGVMAILIGRAGISSEQTEHLKAAIDLQSSSARPSVIPAEPPRLRVIPVVLPGVERVSRSSLPPVMASTSWVQFTKTFDDPKAFQALVAAIRALSAAAGPVDGATAEECPYPGLDQFGVANSAMFFAREALIAQSIEAIGGPGARFLAFLGPSGSGKSSLLRAGALGALKGGALAGSDAWPVALLTPGRDPVESLALALSATRGSVSPDDARDAARAIRDDPAALDRLARRALGDARKAARIVVVVDQFEEVFTVCDDAEARRAFVANLLAAATSPDGPAFILIALRSDYVDRCAGIDPAFAEVLLARQLLVGPLTRDELRRAIESPARRAGVEFEPGLVELLLEDVQGQAGALPLLQLTLRSLWEHRDGRRLTIRAYRDLGGLFAALIRHAETVYATLTGTREQDICRRVFLRLVQPGEGSEDTRRRVSLREVLPADPSQADAVRAVIRRLSKSRLLAIGQGEPGAGDGTLEVGHEALIRGWPRLRQWVEADRAGLRTHRRLTEAAREWADANGPLYTGALLAVAAEWAASHRDDLNPVEANFLSASQELQRQHDREAEARAREAEDAARRLSKLSQWLLVTTAIALLLSLAAVTGGMWAYSEAGKATTAAATAKESEKRANSLARVARSRQLAALSSSERDKRLDRSLLLAVEAYRTEATSEARDGLFKALQDRPGLTSFLNMNKSHGTDVAFSPDGKTLAVGYYVAFGGGVALWDVVRRQPLADGPLTVPEGSVTCVAFSPDGTTLAAGYDDGISRGGVVLWDVVGRKRMVEEPLSGHKGAVNGVAFSPDGRTLASASSDKTVILWDAKSGKPRGDPLSGHTGPVYGVAFSPDGNTLASASGDRTVILWDAKSGKPSGESLSGHNGPVNGVAFSPDGKTLASASDDRTVILWDAKSGKRRGEPLQGHTDRVNGVAFSPAGEALASASGDGTVILWDAKSGRPRGEPLRGATGFAAGVAFSPDGKALAAGYDDGVSDCVVLWDMAERRGPLENRLPVKEGLVTGVAFSPDGTTLAAGFGGFGLVPEGGAVLWDVARRLRLSAAPLPAPGGLVTGVAFSPDGKTLAAGVSRGYDVVLWDVATRQRLAEHPTPANGGLVTGVAFSPDGQTIAAASEDGTVTLWDVKSGRPRGEPLSGHKGAVTGVSFSPDGKTLASATTDQTVILWDVKTGKPRGEPLRGHKGAVTGVAFSPDGNTLASASEDGTVILWDATTGKPRREPLRGYTGPVTGVAFSHDGKTIAAGFGGNFGLVLLWDVATRMNALGGPLPVREGGVTGVAFSPDDNTLAVGFGDKLHGGVMLWDLDPGSWQRLAGQIANRNFTRDEWRQYFPGEPYRATFPDLPVPPEVVSGRDGKRGRSE